MNATCSRCGESHAVTTYPSINVAQDPDLKARVRDGSLFVWECPHCGARNLLKYQTLYHDPAEKLMVWLLPGDAEPPQAVVDAVKELEGYTLRLVREVGDLVEKVNIHACGLDDVLVEMCKYWWRCASTSPAWRWRTSSGVRRSRTRRSSSSRWTGPTTTSCSPSPWTGR